MDDVDDNGCDVAQLCPIGCLYGHGDLDMIDWRADQLYSAIMGVQEKEIIAESCIGAADERVCDD